MADPEKSDETKPTESNPANEKSLFGIQILASAGLTLSLILEFVHARTHLKPTADSFCAVGETLDCTAVAASPLSIFFGVPWALWGAVGYIAILAAIVTKSKWALPLSAVAALASVVLLGVSLLQIGSLCYLCEAVHLTSWLLFFLVWKNKEHFTSEYADTSGALGIFGAPLGILVALMLFLPPYWASFSYKAEPPFATGETEEGHPWIGAENPKFTFQEFIDYNCPHCKVASARSLRRLMKHKDWRLVRRQQPRMRCAVGSKYACQQVRMALCAKAQDRFWQADRWLFANQNPRKNPDTDAFVADLKLDADAFKACYTAKDTYDAAQAEHKGASVKKIVEVPGYLVEDKRYRQDEFEELLQSK